MPVNPTPQRQRVVTFPTPNVSDILFFETVDAERVGTGIPEYGTKHPDHKQWPDHRLVYVEAADDQNRYYRYYYAADQIGQDDDNWSFTQADIGGTRFDAVTREYVIRRSEFDPDTPAMGSAMPDVPEGKFDGTYVLAERRQVPINDKTLNSLYVIEQRTYVKKVPLAAVQFDELSKRNLKNTTTLYYFDEVVASGMTADALFAAPTNAYWQPQIVNASGVAVGAGDDSNVCYGIVREAQQLSDNWYAITERQAVAGVYNHAAGGLSVESYATSVNFAWPPVLKSFEILEWLRLDGSIDRSPYYEFDPEGYSGPCRAVVSIGWYPAAPTNTTDLSTQQLSPRPIGYSSPYFNINIPACLHDSVYAQCDIGTGDPIYAANSDSVRVFPATNYVTWPASLIADDDVRPARGGYLRQVTTVYSPDTVTAGTANVFTAIPVYGVLASGVAPIVLAGVHLINSTSPVLVGYIRSSYGLTLSVDSTDPDGGAGTRISDLTPTNGGYLLRDALGVEIDLDVENFDNETGTLVVTPNAGATSVSLTFTTSAL